MKNSPPAFKPQMQDLHHGNKADIVQVITSTSLRAPHINHRVGGEAAEAVTQHASHWENTPHWRRAAKRPGGYSDASLSERSSNLTLGEARLTGY